MSARKRDGENFWSALPARLLHETQVQVIEAMWWIDHPISASQLMEVLDQKPDLANVAYHVRRLKDLGALEHVKSRQVRGAKEKFYRLVMQSRADEPGR